MGNYSVFDNLGNKIGEANEKGDPLEGGGCCLGTVAIFILGFGMIVIWPLYVSNLDGIGFVGLLIILANLYVHGRMIADKADCSFMKTWGWLITSSTIIPSVSMWIIIGLFEGFSFIVLLMSVFVYFLMSIGGGFVTALIVNRIPKQKDTADDYLEDIGQTVQSKASFDKDRIPAWKMVQLGVKPEAVSKKFIDNAEAPVKSVEYSENPPTEVYDAKTSTSMEMSGDEKRTKGKRVTKVVAKRKGQR